MVSLQSATFRSALGGRDAVSRLHCWPSLDQRREPTRRADAVPGGPTRLPRRGRQSLRWPGGIESWVASDDELTGAWAITPSRFLFERALPQLVEVPSLWVRVPLQGRDPEELLEPITSIVTDHGLPAPHLVVTGQGAVVVLWHIKPLHRPGALKAEATPEEKAKHDRMTAAYSMGLVAWRRAAVKLAFAFAAVGAEPHTAATADAQLLEHIPFPLGPAHPVRLIKDLHEDPPSLLEARHHDPLLIPADTGTSNAGRRASKRRLGGDLSTADSADQRPAEAALSKNRWVTSARSASLMSSSVGPDGIGTKLCSRMFLPRDSTPPLSWPVYGRQKFASNTACTVIAKNLGVSSRSLPTRCFLTAALKLS